MAANAGPPVKDPEAVYLIDLSGYIFRAYHAIRGLRTKDNFPTNAIYGVTRMLARLLIDLPEASLIAVKDAPGPSWRHAVYDQYKANRPPPPEDLAPQFEPIFEIVDAMGIPSVVLDGHEADDLIAGLAGHYAGTGRPVVIISADKDLLQVVDDRVIMWDPMRNSIYDPAKVADKWGVGPDRIADLLALMGDSSDNVPGVPGIGKKRARDLIVEHGSVAALLDDLDGLPDQKWARNLRDDPAAAELSYRLVHLPRTLPAELDPAGLARSTPDLDALVPMFQRFEFFSLVDNLEDAFPAAAAAADGARGEAGGALDGVDVAVVTSPGEVEAWLKSSPLGFDTETTDLVPQKARLVGLSLADAEGGAYVPLGHTDGDNADWDALDPIVRAWAEDAGREKWGQNLKYDAQVLLGQGISLKGIAGDAMLASYLLNPDVRGHGLDALAERELGQRTIHFGDVAPDGQFSLVPVERATEYAVEDAVVAWQLCTKLHGRLREAGDGLWSLYRELELPLVPVLAAMEWAGIRVDVEALKAMGGELTTRLQTIEAEVMEAAGRPLNIQSPKQIGELLFDELGLDTSGVRRTKTGSWSTNAEVLERLQDAHPIVAQILEHRNLAKLKSTYVDALQTAVLPETGRIHPDFHRAVAATGRLSCANPNLQNIPIRDEWGHRIRGAFVPAEGHLFVGADYSQIELRILAHMSGDPGLLAAFRGGEDVHARTAAEVFDVEPGAVEPEQRRAAKAINFGLMYGMGAQSLGRGLGIPTTEAKAYIDRYFERYPKVGEFRQRLIDGARERGYVETLYGRRRWIPDLGSGNPRLEAQGERIAVNTPIQGSAADIIKRAMLRVYAALAKEFPRARLLLQVHDELLVEAPADQARAVRDLLVDAMEAAAELDVPLEVEAGMGESWDAAHG